MPEKQIWQIKLPPRLPQVFLLIICFAIPFLSSRSDLPVIRLVAVFTPLIGISLLGFLTMMANSHANHHRGVITFTGIYIVSLALSTWHSVHPLTSLFGLQESKYLYSFLQLSSGALLSYSLYIWISTKSTTTILQLINRLSIVITIAFLLSSTTALQEAFNLFTSSQLLTRVVGNVGEANRFSFYLITLIPIFVNVSGSRKMQYRIMGLISVIAAIVLIIFAQTRGSWLILIILASLSLLIFRKKIHATHLLTTITILVSSSLFLVITSQSTRIIQHSQAVIADLKSHSGSITLRLAEWQDAAQLIKQEFTLKEYLIGIGPQTTTYQILHYRTPQPTVSPDQRDLRTYILRNHYLTVFLETGAVGLFLWLFFIKTIVSFYLKHQHIQATFQLLFISWLSIILIGCIYYIPSSNYFYFWLLTAFISYPIFQQQTAIKVTSLLTTRIIIIFMLAAIIAFYIYFLADMISQNQGQKLAAQLIPWETKYERAVALQLINHNVEHDQKDRLKADKAMEISKTIIAKNPNEVDNYYTAFRAYFFSSVWFNDPSFLTDAETFAVKQLQLDPSRAKSYDDYGQILLHTHRLELAKAMFEKAVELNPDFYHSYMHLGEVSKQLNQFDQANQYYDRAVKINPDAKDFVYQKRREILQITIESAIE